MLPPEDSEPSAPHPRPLPAVGWRDRAADLLALGAGRPATVVVLAVVLLGAVLVLGPMVRGVASEPAGTPVEASLPMAGATPVGGDGTGGTGAGAGAGSQAGGDLTAATSGSGQGTVVAHAAGAVVSPGVYELPATSRVDDLVAMAGGLSGDADHDRVNLALPLVDGERVYVPRVGEVDVPEAPGPTGAAQGGGGSATSGGGDGPVDVNRADVTELERLPGVGPVTAQAIVDHREQQGPFTAVEDLLDVQGIGEVRLGQLRDRVTL